VPPARCPSGCRLKLPPKRIFIHSNSVEFVEERREALDKYLQALLADGQLACELSLPMPATCYGAHHQLAALEITLLCAFAIL
jgi:hypothetical protein